MALSSLGVTLMDGLTVFSLAPITDAIMNSSISSDFKLTRLFITTLGYLGIQPTATNLLLVVLVLNILRAGAYIASHYVIQRLRYTVVRDMLSTFLLTLLMARWEYFAQRKTGFLLNIAQREVNRIGEATRIIGTVFANGLQLFILLCIPFYLSWKVTLLIFSIGLILVSFLSLINKRAHSYGKQNVVAANNYTSSLHESIMGMKLIQLYGKRISALRDVIGCYKAYTDIDIKTSMLHITVGSLYIPLGFLMVFFTFAVGTRQGLPIGLVVMMLYSIHQLIPAAKQIATLKTQANTIVPSYFYVNDEMEEANAHKEVHGDLEFNQLSDKIELKNVGYTYSNASKTTLTGVNISIKKGEMVALVGPSGAGKSTIADMLCGILVPNGDLLIDGKSLFEYDLQTYREKIAYVIQDSHLFNTTIRRNLLWSNPDATDKEVEYACRLANAMEFIYELPDGLETIVGERGVRLSGGQAQRISLARAMIRKPELLILDEATSALDSESEIKIQDSIASIAKTTTVVVIAHRLSTIKSANRIYVIKDGKVNESGSYDELIKMDKTFNKMLKQQFEVTH